MPRKPLNHELLLRGRVLALRHTIALMTMRMDRHNRLPFPEELDSLEWLIGRVRKSLRDLERQSCAKDTPADA